MIPLSAPLLAALLGPAATGALIATLGARQVLWIDAASFAISALLVATAVPDIPRTASESAPDNNRYIAQFIAGLCFVRADRPLFALVLVCAAMNLIVGPIESIFVPVYADIVFGSLGPPVIPDAPPASNSDRAARAA